MSSHEMKEQSCYQIHTSSLTLASPLYKSVFKRNFPIMAHYERLLRILLETDFHLKCIKYFSQLLVLIKKALRFETPSKKLFGSFLERGLCRKPL